jgi:hypothetical protein
MSTRRPAATHEGEGRRGGLPEEVVGGGAEVPGAARGQDGRAGPVGLRRRAARRGGGARRGCGRTRTL